MNSLDPPKTRRWWVTAFIIFVVWSLPAILFTAARLIEAQSQGRDVPFLELFLETAYVWYVWALLTLWMLRMERAAFP